MGHLVGDTGVFLLICIGRAKSVPEAEYAQAYAALRADMGRQIEACAEKGGAAL